MIDKASVIKTAQKYLSKGQIDKAIAEWQKLANAFRDGNSYNFLGDLYLKKNDKSSAIVEYHKAAKVYIHEGFSLKALAIFKKVLNLDPKDTQALIALGELNEEKNIFTDAIKYYLAAADTLSKKNRRNELLEVYTRILNLAPKNVQLKTKVAELFSKEGFVAEAASEYCSIGRLYSEQHDYENAKSFIMKAIEIQPSNKGALMELSSLAELTGNLDQAINYMHSAMEKAGADSELLMRNAQLLIKKGSVEEATKLISDVLAKEPNNRHARKLLGELHEKNGNLQEAWQEYSAVIDSMVADDNPQEAVKILATYKEFEPIENRKRLAAIYRNTGDEAGLFNELYGLYDAYLQKGMQNEAIESLKEALDIQPDNSDARANLEALQSKAEASPPPAEGPSAPSPQEHAGPAPAAPDALDLEGQEKPVEVALTEVDVFLRYGLYNDARNLLETLRAKHPDSIDLHQKLKTLYVDTKDTEQAVTECIVLSTLYERSGDEAKSQSLIQEALRINPSDPRLEGKAKAAAPEGEASLAEHVEELSEADFYIQQGFYKEAVDVFRRLSEKFPDNNELKTRLQEAEQLLAQPPDEKPAEVGAGALDITSILEDVEIPGLEGLDSDGSQDLDMDTDVLDIFNEFKKGLAKEIEAEDSETHYNLGIAYKEMGLVGDAIKEFQTAQHDPAFFNQAKTMLGFCYMQKGQSEQAIEAFSAALMKSDSNSETAWSLKYDLAMAYEQKGDQAEAMRILKEVHGWNPKFRDVAAKLAALKNSEGGASSGPGKGKPSRVSYI